MVEELQNKAFKRKNEEWLSYRTDYESISDVLNIPQGGFKQRGPGWQNSIQNLLDRVLGGDYAISSFFCNQGMG